MKKIRRKKGTKEFMFEDCYFNIHENEDIRLGMRTYCRQAQYLLICHRLIKRFKL